MSEQRSAPAFPQYAIVERTNNAGHKYLERTPIPGMTLRDYFTGQAIVGLLSNNDAILGHLKQGLTAAGINESSRVLAIAAGIIANEMLREKEEFDARAQSPT